MAIRPQQRVVLRGELGKQFETFAKLTKDEIALQIGNAEALFEAAIELEIDARIAQAFKTHNRARHRTLRERWADFLVRARS